MRNLKRVKLNSGLVQVAIYALFCLIVSLFKRPGYTHALPVWIGYHGSNLVQGLFAMSFVHRIGEIFCPRASSHWLKSAMGMNVLGNIWEEISLFGEHQRGLPFFHSAGRIVYTDTTDFMVGIVATLLYLGVTLSVDSGWRGASALEI